MKAFISGRYGAKATGWSCKQIPEFAHLLAEGTELKKMLLEKTGGGEAFVEEAAKTLHDHVLSTLPYGGQSFKFISRLRKKGIDRDTLARALASAWLNGADYFELPCQSTLQRLRSTQSLLILSVLMALGLISSAMLYFRRLYPDVETVFLSFPPLMAMLGALVTALAFGVLRKFL